MRILAAILVFLLTAQPAPAGSCDMPGVGDGAARAGAQHDPAAHDRMRHEQHDNGSMSGHECCDSDGATDPGCNDPGRCGACVHGVSAVTLALALIPVAPPAAVPAVREGDPLAASHPSHPYRPPRTIS